MKRIIHSCYKGRKSARDDNGRWRNLSEDALILVEKDSETNTSKLRVLEQPTMPFYMSQNPRKFPEVCVKKEELVEYPALYADRTKLMAQALGWEKQYFNAQANRAGYEFKRELYRHPNLYLGDTNIEDYYRTTHMMEHGSDVMKFNKGYADIEVDIFDYPTFPDPETAPCKINLINYLYKPTRTIYSLILRDPTNPAIAAVEADLEGFNEYLKQFLPEGNVYNNKYIFFETEADLIVGFFQVVHRTKPDFCMFWNIDFDIRTILKRLEYLGLDPAPIICHPEVPPEHQFCWYERDAKADAEDSDMNPAFLFHWLHAPSYTQFIDQMSVYANLRKVRIQPSYKLDDIGEKVAKFKKLGLEEHGCNIKNVSRKNFPLFLAYGIRDVIVQEQIEDKVQDIEQFVFFAGSSRVSKGTKVSVTNKNLIMLVLMEQGYIIGNNVDYNVKEFVEGAIVAPVENLASRGIKVFGYETLLFKAVVDYDAASQYPNMMIAYNISKPTMYGRIVKVEHGGKYLGDGFDFNILLETIDSSIFDLGEKFFGLPSFEEVVQTLQKT